MKDKIFGYELILDLYDCDLEVLKSKKKLDEYVNILCPLIKMEKYKKTMLEYFGTKKSHTKGYSLLQFIETSSITGHFSEHWRIAYINIFSCKAFNPETAKKFSKVFFKASKVKSRFIKR
jgi:S-adenosylmethionine/arginine decarboxylase-like enzyme